MEKSFQNVREHISILKKIDSYIQHKLSDWEFKELVRTLAVEIENNRKLITDLEARVNILEGAHAPASTPLFIVPEKRPTKRPTRAKKGKKKR